MAGSLQVPPSPSSSKRSRSRDSARSATATTAVSSLDAPYLTPFASAPSLIIPAPGEQTHPQPAVDDPTPYPAFLRSSRSDIAKKFNDLEWQQRQRFLQAGQNDDSEQPSRWARLTGDDIKERNRYLNVDPFQSNRVCLQVPEGLNDYINASPVELRLTKSGTVLKYIATQGPKFDTTSHFWRMVWHETTSPAVVVMLTRTHEASREKCYPYYPKVTEHPTMRLNAQDEYGDGFIHDLTLASLEDQEEVRAQVRELDMTSEDGNDTRKIWHLLFAGWPDFLVPDGEDRVALLALIRMSREKNADNATNPRIVHCSAGVGRSGTFIALDWLLQELADGQLDEIEDSVDPIMQLVDNLRQQRMMMVQSEPQLAFIYDVLQECWRERWIEQHAEEAERLGLTSHHAEDQPRLKRQKSGPSDPDAQIDVEEYDRAELEAELCDSEMDFEKGKT